MAIVQIPCSENPSLLKTITVPDNSGPKVFPKDRAPAVPNQHRQPAKA